MSERTISLNEPLAAEVEKVTQAVPSRFRKERFSSLFTAYASLNPHALRGDFDIQKAPHCCSAKQWKLL